MRPRPFRLRNVLVMLLVALFVNAPLAYDTHVHRRLARDGRDTTAFVLDKRIRNGQHELVVTIGASEISDDTYVETVDGAMYERVAPGDQLPARVVPGTHLREVEGAQRTDVPLGLAVLGDGGLVFVAAGMLLYRRRLRVPALWAVEDVRLLDDPRDGRGSLLRVGSAEWIVSGEVVELDVVSLEIDTGNERVRVELAGHANPVGRHEHAQVVGRVPPGRMSA